MNWFSLLKMDPGQILEYFIHLVHEQFWFSVLILAVALAIIIVYFGTIARSFWVQAQRLLSGSSVRYVVLLTAIGLFVTTVFSIGIVTYLRATPIPVPSLSTIQPVFGEDQMLQWSLPSSNERTDLMFEVQWSTDTSFSRSATTSYVVRDTIFPLSASVNKTLYWRVRAVEFDPDTLRQERFGAWSRPVKIDQFVDVLEKVARTRQLWVAMENEFGRSKLRWYEHEIDKHASNVEEWIAFYRGLEVELAYAIADQACRTLLEGKVENGKTMVCVSSRPRAATEKVQDCGDKKCVSIQVRFAALGWPEVMIAVGEGRYDVAISSITYTTDRENRYHILFGTRSYRTTDFALVSRQRAGRPALGHNVTDPATLKGLRVAVGPQSTSHECMQWLKTKLESEGDKKGFELVMQSRGIVALNALLHDRAPFEVIVRDGTFADGWKARYGDALEVQHTTPEFFGGAAPEFCKKQEYRIAVRAGEYALQALTDSVVGVMQEGGLLGRLETESERGFAGYIRTSPQIQSR